MKKWFVLFFPLYLFVYVSNRLGYIYPQFIQSYFRDLMCIPILAPISVWFMRWYTHDPEYTLKFWQMGYIVVLVSISFEIIAPHFSKKYTADSLDVIMYVLGAWFYWVFMNSGAKLVKQSS